MKLVGEEVIPPRHLDDQEEQALVVAVTNAGKARDRAIILLMLHTGLVLVACLGVGRPLCA